MTFVTMEFILQTKNYYGHAKHVINLEVELMILLLATQVLYHWAAHATDKCI